MYFTKAVAIFISGIFAPAMIDTLMCIAPSLKTGINAVLIRVNQGSWLNGVFDLTFRPFFSGSMKVFEECPLATCDMVL